MLNAISTTSDRKDSMEPLFEMASGIKSTDISEDNYVVLGNLILNLIKHNIPQHISIDRLKPLILLNWAHDSHSIEVMSASRSPLSNPTSM